MFASPDEQRAKLFPLLSAFYFLFSFLTLLLSLFFGFAQRNNFIICMAGTHRGGGAGKGRLRKKEPEVYEEDALTWQALTKADEGRQKKTEGESEKESVRGSKAYEESAAA